MGEQIDPNAACASCWDVHRFWVHAGRKRTCQMASCQCEGFVAKVEVSVEDEAPTAAAMLEHSHKRMHLETVGEVYKWFDEYGAPCPSCE